MYSKCNNQHQRHLCMKKILLVEDLPEKAEDIKREIKCKYPDIQIGEWVEAISIVLDLLDAEVENRNTNKIAPCEHAGIDYFYYPLTDEWYIDLAAGEEHSLNLYINYCPICGRRLP